jgi:Trp operon repressor
MDNRLKLRQGIIEALIKAPDLSHRRIRRKLGISARQVRIATKLAKRARAAQASAE